MQRSGLVGLLVLCVSGSLSACGGAAGEKVRPQDFTASGAMGVAPQACTGRPQLARPIVVDLESGTRGDLEVSMRKGVVIVSYDCKSLRVLAGCTVPQGTYDYAGVQLKEDVLQLKNQDDLSVNLPFSSVKLGAEMHSGRAIDLAMVAIGRRSTTVWKVERSELGGGCEGATHFVQTAQLGAFSMTTGSVGKVGMTADIFKAGASGTSESSRAAKGKDGSLESCHTADPEAAAPPAQCHGPLRVELLPIVGGEEPAAAPVVAKKSETKSKSHSDEESAPIENPCPAGYLFAGGLCTRAAGTAHLCKPKDAEECRTECDKGSAESCYNLAQHMPRRTPAAERAAVYKKACDAGFGDGCAWYSLYARPREFDASSMPRWKDVQQAAALGCSKGSGVSCQFLGDILDAPVDFPGFASPSASTHAYERGCMLGHGDACGEASVAYRQGNGVTANPIKAVALLDKACQAGSNDQCADLAELLAEGSDGVTKDSVRAYPIARKACRKEAVFCMQAVKLGIDTKQDDQEIFRLAERGCTADDDACVKLGELYDAGRGTTKDSAKAREIWTKVCKAHDDEAACGHLGAAKPPGATKGVKPAAARPSKGAGKTVKNKK